MFKSFWKFSFQYALGGFIQGIGGSCWKYAILGWLKNEKMVDL